MPDYGKDRFTIKQTLSGKNAIWDCLYNAWYNPKKEFDTRFEALKELKRLQNRHKLN